MCDSISSSPSSTGDLQHMLHQLLVQHGNTEDQAASIAAAAAAAMTQVTSPSWPSQEQPASAQFDQDDEEDGPLRADPSLFGGYWPHDMQQLAAAGASSSSRQAGAAQKEPEVSYCCFRVHAFDV